MPCHNHQVGIVTLFSLKPHGVFVVFSFKYQGLFFSIQITPFHYRSTSSSWGARRCLFCRSPRFLWTLVTEHKRLWGTWSRAVQGRPSGHCPVGTGRGHFSLIPPTTWLSSVSGCGSGRGCDGGNLRNSKKDGGRSQVTPPPAWLLLCAGRCSVSESSLLFPLLKLPSLLSKVQPASPCKAQLRCYWPPNPNPPRFHEALLNVM